MDRWVYERFGSRTGFVRFFAYWLLSSMGGYRHLPQTRPQPNQRLVFVCSGNICRSPLAEAYARSLGKPAASCGLNCDEGYPADPRAKKFAELHGISLNYHKTVNVKDFEFRCNDRIVVMEPSHISSFKEKVDGDHQICLAGSFCKRPRPYIHDPYNCCSEFFNICESRVLEAVRGICA